MSKRNRIRLLDIVNIGNGIEEKNTNRKVCYTEVLSTDSNFPTKASKRRGSVQSGVNQN